MQQYAMLNVGPAFGAGRSATTRAFFFIRWSFYLFAFLVPLENLDLFMLRGTFTLPRMAGVLVAVVALLQPQLCLAKPPKALWCFIGYLLVGGLVTVVLAPEQLEDIRRPMWTIIQNIIMFWICYNLMRDDSFAKWTLLWFGAGAVGLALFAFLGVSETSVTTNEGVRVSALAQNANMFSYLMSLGALSLLGLALGRTRVKPIWALLLYAPSMLLIGYTVASGSRGGMLCLAVGIAVLLFRGGKLGTRIKTLLLMMVVLVAGARELLKSDLALERWRSTLETGDLARREGIFRECWYMFCEKPIFGWGQANHLVVLATRTEARHGNVTDPHNDLLWALTATGLAGTIFFVAGFGLCAWGAWRGRKAAQGYLPLVLILAAVTMSMSTTVHSRKATWIMAAYAAASATYVAPATPRRRPQPGRNGP